MTDTIDYKLEKARNIVASIEKKVFIGVITTTTKQDHLLLNQLKHLKELLEDKIMES